MEKSKIIDGNLELFGDDTGLRRLGRQEMRRLRGGATCFQKIATFEKNASRYGLGDAHCRIEGNRAACTLDGGDTWSYSQPCEMQ